MQPENTHMWVIMAKPNERLKQETSKTAMELTQLFLVSEAKHLLHGGNHSIAETTCSRALRTRRTSHAFSGKQQCLDQRVQKAAF